MHTSVGDKQGPGKFCYIIFLGHIHNFISKNGLKESVKKNC